jgi:hypothetical protein
MATDLLSPLFLNSDSHEISMAEGTAAPSVHVPSVFHCILDPGNEQQRRHCPCRFLGDQVEKHLAVVKYIQVETKSHHRISTFWTLFVISQVFGADIGNSSGRATSPGMLPSSVGRIIIVILLPSCLFDSSQMGDCESDS